MRERRIEVAGARLWTGTDSDLRWMVGGHSWGANLALAWALAHPERARALIYVAGNGLQNDRSWSAAYHEALQERGERQPNYRTPPNRKVNEEGNRSWRDFIRQPLLWRRIASLDIPVLVVMAEHDVRPDWPARQLAAVLPDSRFEIIAEAEHWIWSKTGSAAALREILRDFLSTLS